MATPKATVSKLSIPKPPTAKLAKTTNPKAPALKATAGLGGYLNSSKMKPVVKNVKAQLNTNY